MATRRLGSALVLFLPVISGCVQTSDLYAVRQWEDPRPADPDDRPRINYDQLEAKRSFVERFDTLCPLPVGGPGLRKDTWDARNPEAAACVQQIAAYAVDQCITITRRQNVVSADANLALGAVTLASGLAAVTYAIKGSSDDRVTAASLVGATSASNQSRSFIPSTNTIVQVSTMLKTATDYAAALGLTAEDIKIAHLYKLVDADRIITQWRATRSQLPKKDRKNLKVPDIPGDDKIILWARVHDAVLANCGANAYGLVPAHKPRH
jgi:hypothetical protein